MNGMIAVTEMHVATYRQIRSFIYRNGRAPGITEIETMLGGCDLEDVYNILTELKAMGYLRFDDHTASDLQLCS